MTSWLHVCYPGHIRMALERYGHTRMAYKTGKNGMFGLKPEIKDRRGTLPKMATRAAKSSPAGIRKLLDEFT
ncbi:hypothetical protein [Deinococcus kurensis]|uniref:hypothetical protein n=1 Tax=Deinococcus kurensis TaxID=2662757 RepID=UPI0012D35FC4|nr:hypothetical protein [Deinococcus kurensis]